MHNRTFNSSTAHPGYLRSLLLAAALTAGAVSPAFLTGCGSTTTVQQQESVGKQLADLEQSYKDGIITQKEYERLKKAIIKNND